MVLVFEVWILRGAVSPMDRVVGWGAFPVCDHEFRTIEGKCVNCTSSHVWGVNMHDTLY